MTHYVGNHQMQQGGQAPQTKQHAVQERSEAREGGEQVFTERAEKKAKEKQRLQQ